MMTSDTDATVGPKAKRMPNNKADGDQAMREYRQAHAAAREKTEKLRALRLAHEAEQAQRAAEKAAAAPKRKRKTTRAT
jgi:hypothetical protein